MFRRRRKTKKKHDEFVLDSGTTKHACEDLSLFKDVKSTNSYQVTTASDTILATKMGPTSPTISLQVVLHWLGASNLISVCLITEKGFDFKFDKAAATYTEIPRLKDDYRLPFVYPNVTVFDGDVQRNLQIWHVSIERLRYTLGSEKCKIDT